ncbi:TIGR02678 family protein [Candidatus Poriferisodalis sp.]|uniref:TIGR02678 family protein n=1 Tax=Candidatus Poriferisodalis sp. TaxID=3101277 RepID=UPI003B028704
MSGLASLAADRHADELREAAGFLAVHPLIAAERHPEEFGLVRRHHQQLDQWFTQRFGYRLEISADTARLYKTTVVPSRRPLRTAGTQPRPFRVAEYRALALVLAAVVSGPNVVSLRDLVDSMRAAAADAGIEFSVESADRRALVTALRWMIVHGLAIELHHGVDAYREDQDADAVLEIRPDRVAALPLNTLAGAESVDQLIDRTQHRRSARSWMRALLLEEPVVYRGDLSEAEWFELRRRLGEESGHFEEMFGMCIEARAEGLMAVDETGRLTDVTFPPTGTIGQAALLLIDRLAHRATDRAARADVDSIVRDLAAEHDAYWSELRKNPERLAAEALELLADHRLVETNGSNGDVLVLPAAFRYAAEVSHEEVPLL